MSRDIPADHQVVVNVNDLQMVLRAVDYVGDRRLVGPVDRMGDAAYLVRSRLTLDKEQGMDTSDHFTDRCQKVDQRTFKPCLKEQVIYVIEFPAPLGPLGACATHSSAMMVEYFRQTGRKKPCTVHLHETWKANL